MSLRDYPVTVVEDVDSITVSTSPAYAPDVSLFIIQRHLPRRRGYGWVVSRTSDGHAIITEHTKREAAMRSAIYRARRYAAAYHVPRGMAVTS